MIAYCTSFKIAGDSGFGVALYTRNEKRIFSIPIDSSSKYTTNQLALLAIKYAMLSNKSKSPLKIECSNKYATEVLGKDQNGDWIKNPRLNIELVDEIRKIVDAHSDHLSIIHNKNPDIENEIRSTTDEW